MDKQIHIGRIVSSDTLGLSLHDAARKGQKKALKQVLQKGIFVDYPNDEGQSALFCACCENRESTAKILLKAGANPNERSNCGMTPLHMACYNGNVALLVKLIEAGGDLRLHDFDGRSPKDWAVMIQDPKKRIKMVEFLEKSHMFAVTHSGRDLTTTSNTGNISGRIPSLIQMLRKKVGIDPSLHIDPLKRVQSMGFGSVYLAGEAQGAVVSVIPVVSENALYHDSQGVTYENGSFLVMESMSWNTTAVTVKRLHKQSHPGGYVDVLITEMEHLGKIRHPSVLLLMGVCQTTSLDSIILVFERIGLGSLYFYLHQRVERLPTQNIRDILLQICSALIFLHNQNFIHCNISSHAINLVTPFCAKLGNFEHMIDSSKADMGKQSAVTQIKYQNALYNWMAPELMRDQPASFLCDVYSYSCIMWEMFECEIPWDMCDADLIKHKLLVEKQQLRVESTRMPLLFKSIINLGLQLDPYDRNADFDKIYQWLMGHPDQPIPKTTPRHEASPSRMSSGKRSRTTSATPSPSKKHDSNVHTSRNPSAHANAPYMEEYSPTGKPKRNVHYSKKGMSPYSDENHHNQHHPEEAGKSRTGNRVKITEDGICPLEERTKRQYKETSQGKIPFSAGDRDWVCNVQRSTDKDFYSYSAKMEKDIQAPPRYSPHDGDSTYAKEYDVDKSSDSSTDEDDNLVMKKYLHDKAGAKYYSGKEKDHEEISFRNQRDYIPSSPRSVPLSPSKFSYLKLGETCSQGQSVVKPASHCTEAGCPKTSGQLTTAGSLFALYNSGTDLGALSKIAVGAPPNQYSTFPRNKKSSHYYDEYERYCASPENDTDPQWFAGKGSVKNLVHLFQEQADEHDFHQKVLDGKIDYNDYTTNNSKFQVKTPEKIFQTHGHEKMPPMKGLEYQKFVEASSGEHYDTYTDHRNDRKQCTGIDKDLSETESDSQRSYSSVSSSSTGHNTDQCSSVDSDLLSSWITDQIKKAKTAVAREKALEYQKQHGSTRGLLDEIIEEMSKSQHSKQGKQQFQGSKEIYGQRSKQEFDLKEFYIDDDISADNEDKSHIKLHGNSDLGSKVQHKDWKYQMRSKSDIKSRKDKPNHKKIEKKYKREGSIPKPKAITRPMMMSAVQKDKLPSKGFTTTVTVESSLVHPGEHHLRHMATDLATGETKVLHQETVQATTVRSTLEA